MLRAAVPEVIAKFAAAELKHGYDDAFLRCGEAALQRALAEHVKKGDPRDVAVYALLMVYRGFRAS